MRAHRALTIALVAALPLVGLAAPVSAAPPRASSIAWAPCEDATLSGFQCGTLEVPRDWDDSSKGVFELAVVRHRSTGTSAQRIGSLFFNPGGPGGSGLAVMPLVWSELPSTTKQRFDLVSWDPRGVGATLPSVECDLPEWPLPAAVGPVDWDAIAASIRDQVRDANEQCVTDHSDIAPYLGTNNVVRDLDALRAAVGDSKLNYWGASYGTRIGYAYALTYPDRMRAIILDGPVNPRGSIEDFALGYSTAADPALGILFELYPQTRAQYRRVMASLETAPLRLSATRNFTRWDVGLGLEASAPSQSGLPQLAQWLGKIDKAISGTAVEKRKAKEYLRRLPQMPAYAMAGVPAIINCLDYADRPDAARLDVMGTRIRFDAPITGWVRAVQIPPACEGLEELTPDPVPLVQGNDWSARMLILAATRDSQTPYRWATSMANAFRSSPLVSYVGNQHVTYTAAGSPCVDGAATTYLVSLKLPGVDVACPLAARP